MITQGGDDNAGDGIEYGIDSRLDVDLTQRELLFVHMIGYKHPTVGTIIATHIYPLCSLQFLTCHPWTQT